MTLSDLISPVLDREQERDLIAAIQGTRIPSEFPERDVEQAWEMLIAAHHRAIHAAAGRVPSMEREEAYATALEAFVVAVMEFDLDLGLRLSTMAYPAMAHAVFEAASADHPIRLPRGIMNRYLALMKRADGDFGAAYQMSLTGGFEISPFSMIAAHRALSDHMDAEVVLGEQKNPFRAFSAEETGGDGNLTAAALKGLSWTPQPEHEEIDVYFVRDLFAQVTDEQETAIRLAHGFRSLTLDALRVEAGFQEDEALNERELGVVLGTSRSSARRRVQAGLQTMRDYVQSNIDAEEN